MQLSVSVAATSTAAAADKAALEQRSQAVQAFFQDRLGLAPADNTGAYLSYHIPASQAPALPEFLQALEAAGPELGVTDVNIGLTSLEEVSQRSRFCVVSCLLCVVCCIVLGVRPESNCVMW